MFGTCGTEEHVGRDRKIFETCRTEEYLEHVEQKHVWNV
jgi:hypothetical protein